jgi:hypothetical protein
MLAAFARHALVAATLALASAPAAPWRPDRGDGGYRNPVLFADDSDPDAGGAAGLFASAAGPGPAGHADVDWFRVE